MSGATSPSQETTYGEAKFFARLDGAIAAISALVILAEVVRWVYEWLKYGSVEKVVLGDWLNVPHVKWVGVQRVISFVWNLPIFVVAFVATIIFGWLWEYYDGQAKTLGTKK